MAFSTDMNAQRKQHAGKVCGDPTAACKGKDNFQPYDISFDTGKNFVIAESEFFYAVILNSFKFVESGNCEKAYPEKERLATQELFPHNKVFASKCSETGENYYSGMKQGTAFLGVFAGKTLAQANAFLTKVKATGKYSDAFIRRTRAGINGT